MKKKNISLDWIWKALVLGHEYHIFVLTKQSNTRTLLCEDFEYGVHGAWGVLHKYSCWRCCSENTRFGSQDSLTLSETRSSGNSKRLNLGFDYYQREYFNFFVQILHSSCAINVYPNDICFYIVNCICVSILIVFVFVLRCIEHLSGSNLCRSDWAPVWESGKRSR